MNSVALQTRLKQFSHLVPSQRDLLERFLFQLTFNDFHHVQLIGAEGSGKSTLALAIAELFSEQMNIAFISQALNTEQTSKQLMQQWFTVTPLPDIPLHVQVNYQLEHSQPLLLIVDDYHDITDELHRLFLSLPCKLVSCSNKVIHSPDLQLTIPYITQADAGQLLANEPLNAVSVAERLTRSDNNLYLLLSPPAVTPLAIAEKKWLKISSLVALLLIILILFWWLVIRQHDVTANVDKTQIPFPVSIPEQTPPNVATEITVIADEVLPADQKTDEILPEPVESSVEEPLETPPETVVQVTDSAVTDIEDHTEPQIADTTETSATVTSVGTTDIARTEIPTVAETTAVFAYDEAQLLAIPETQRAVQLILLSTAEAVARFRQTYPQLAVLCYQRRQASGQQFVLLLAPFADAAAAREALNALPQPLRTGGPFIKSLTSVHQEINAFHAEQNSQLE